MRWWKRLKKDNPEKLAELRDELDKEGGVEKNDTFAMVFSALIVFIPVALVILLAIAALILIPLWLM